MTRSEPRIAVVLARGGPAYEYVLPRLRRRGEPHAFVMIPTAGFAREQIERNCESITEWFVTRETTYDEVVDAIASFARRLRADVLLTFSEFALHTTTDACLKLGMRGAGPNMLDSRDKWRMRTRWREAGVPGPRFLRVDDLTGLEEACRTLELPFLLKPAYSAGSIGQRIVRTPEEAADAWDHVHRAVVAAFRAGYFEYGVEFERLPFVAEEIIDSTTESWYEVPGYGDYLSVEGTVADGTYYPICVTGRLPTVEPFTELSNQAPCVLDEERQRAIERTARKAVDALGLGTCSTHTEIKLTADRGLCLIESAARLPGAMVPREVEEAWGVDMVGLLVDVLLGDTSRVPKDMLVHGAPRAAATLAFMATDSRGEPWKTLPVFHLDRIEWGNLVSPGTTVEIVEGATIPPGTQVPPYDVAGGILNFGGLFFLVSRDAETLLRDSYSILDNLEAELQRTQSVAEPAHAPGR